jgi:uncharacterized protein involved in propanediol utilization
MAPVKTSLDKWADKRAMGSAGAAEGTRASGMGTSGHHHGEILQGAVSRDGELLPCLITMPVRGVGSTARYISMAPGVTRGEMLGAARLQVSTCSPKLEVVPSWKKKAERAAGLALAFIGARPAGRLEIVSTVATGVGLGSSTCDVVAAIRAVCDAHGYELDAGQVARLAVEAEGASDPIMFDREVVLFAQRHGRVIESLGSWMPRYTVLSIDTDSGATGIDTLSLPLPQYAAGELAAFESMVRRAREAFRRHDAAAIAAIATESATLNQRFLPLPNFREIRALADEHRALGVQISHSGTVVGVLFDAEIVQTNDARVTQLMARVRSLGARPLGSFTSGADP